ncbi:MAG: MATE family efflux transporter, partial [Bacteroidota bacterium]
MDTKLATENPTTTGPPPSPLPFVGHLRATLKLAWPVIAGQVGHVIIGNADTIMIGELGSAELAAASLANGVFFFVAVLGFGLAIAISPITAQALGAKKGHAALGDIFHQSVLVSLIFGAILVGAIMATGLLMPYLGQKPEVVALADSYLNIIALSALPMMIFSAYKAFIEGYEDMLPGMLITFVMVGLNILFNYLLIYGKGGLPELGLDGAGISTLLARWLSVFMLVGYTLAHPRYRSFKFYGRVFRVKWETMKEILRVGLPSGLQYFFEVGAFVGAVVLAGWIGKEAQSAHQIAVNVASITFMFYLGLSSAASIRVGNALGRKDFGEMRKAGFAGLAAGLGFVVLFSILILIFRHDLPGYYIDEWPVVDLAIRLLLIGALFQFFDCIQAISLGILRGMADVRIPTGITFIAYWIVGLPSAYVLSEVMGFGAEGIWAGLTLGLLLECLLLVDWSGHSSRHGPLELQLVPQKRVSWSCHCRS